MANLETDKLLDKHLKPIKSGEESTSLELATEDNGAKIKGDLHVTGMYEGFHIRELDTDVHLELEGTRMFHFNLAGLLTMYQYGEPANYFRMGVGTNAATTIATEDGSATAAHITIQPDGDLILDPTSQKTIINATDKLYLDGGTETYIHETSSDKMEIVVGGDEMVTIDEANQRVTIEAEKLSYSISGGGGTEWSATDSAYAGTILGYTRLEGDGSNTTSHEIQNSMTVEDSSHQITFKTPPSENVEIEATFLINAGSTDTRIDIGLSDNSTYNSIGIKFEYDNTGIAFGDDEVDDGVRTVKWVLGASELAVVGSSNTFYIGFSTSGVTKTAYLTYGYRTSHGIAEHPFVIKATALPTTIYDGT